MIAKFRSLWLGLAAVLCLLLVVGCGNTFRQFITPVPGPSGDPGDLSHAVVTSTNPAASGLGSNLHVNVSGDSLSGVVPLGPTPFFFGYGQGRAFTLDANGNLLTYTGLAPLTTALQTAAPPAGANGQVAVGMTSGGAIYVVNSATDNVSPLSATSSAFSSPLALPATSHKPVMVAAGLADKVYVVNNTSNDVTVISTLDNNILKTIPVGPSPIWAVMSSDGVNVFVVNQGDGTVSVLDTTLDIEVCSDTHNVVPCTPANRIHVGTSAGSSPNFAFFDGPRRRVYVTNTGENTVSVIKADGVNLGVNPPIVPTLLANVTVSGRPTSVTALADGTRAYAALGGCPAGVNHLTIIASLPLCTGNLVSVIDAVGLLQSSTILVGPGAVSITSASDSSRVYVISAFDTTTIKDNNHNPNCVIGQPCTSTGGPCIALPCLAGPPLPDRTFPTTPSVSVIKTSTNTVIRYGTDPSLPGLIPTFLTPAQNPTCVATIDLNFNKTFGMPCAGQIPFHVLVIP
jgi:YVTN family beta-propeller protein